MRKKDVFTTIEVIIIFIVVGVIGTFAIPFYVNAVESMKEQSCELNLRAILGAVEMQAEEDHALPASLGRLRDDHLRRAWAKVSAEKGPLRVASLRLFHALDEFQQAYAQPVVRSLEMFICPADTTPPPEGCSYGINSLYASMDYEVYKNLPGSSVIIADSDTPVFTTKVFRHKHVGFGGVGAYALAITKAKEIIHEGSSGSLTLETPQGTQENSSSSLLSGSGSILPSDPGEEAAVPGPGITPQETEAEGTEQNPNATASGEEPQGSGDPATGATEARPGEPAGSTQTPTPGGVATVTPPAQGTPVPQGPEAGGEPDPGEPGEWQEDPNNPTRPGWGYGDENHEHTGPRGAEQGSGSGEHSGGGAGGH